MEVRMPDGTIIQNVPDGITRSELERRLGLAPPEDQTSLEIMDFSKPAEPQAPAGDATAAPEPGAGEGLNSLTDNVFSVAGRFAFRDFLDVFLGLPDAVVTSLAQVPSPANLLKNPFNSDSLGDLQGATLLEDVTGNAPPRVGSRVLPIPRSNEIAAGIDVAKQLPGIIAEGRDPFRLGQQFDGALSRDEQKTQQLREEFPTASTVGELIGTGAALFTGRAPLVRQSIKTSAKRALTPTGPKFSDPSALSGGIASLPERLRKSVDKTLKSPKLKRLSRGAGRTLEAGLEGGILSLLNDGDPLETAAFAAGGQALGSAALGSIQGATKSAKNLAITAAGLIAVARLSQEFFPGEKNIFDATDFAFDKVQYGLVLGALAGMIGAARGKRTADNIFEVSEALTAIPRGAYQAFVEKFTHDGDAVEIMRLAATEPEFFSAAEQRRLLAGVKNNNLPQIIKRLKKKGSFRRRLNAISELPATAS